MEQLVAIWTYYRPKKSADGILFWACMKEMKPWIESHPQTVRLIAQLIVFFVFCYLGCRNNVILIQ